MDEPTATPQDAPKAAPLPEAADAAAPEPAETPPAGAADVPDDVAGSPPAETDDERRGGGLRVLVSLVMLPWLLGYGIIGTWTVVRGASAAAAGLKTFDAGYTRLVSPGGVILVGALLLAAFAVLLAASMLLVLGSRRGGTWAAVAVVAVLLVAGSVWAATRGGLSPVLWVFFFFGLVYAAAVAVVSLIGVTRASGRGRIAQP